VTDRAESFAKHAKEQRLRWLALTPEERLAWLEGAKRFERAVRAAAGAAKTVGPNMVRFKLREGVAAHCGRGSRVTGAGAATDESAA